MRPYVWQQAYTHASSLAFERTHCDETRITRAVASSAAKPRDGVRQAICVPIARVLFLDGFVGLCVCVFVWERGVLLVTYW